jgi:dipeptidyl aminopeptidase/acylaminoacyl peptidase
MNAIAGLLALALAMVTSAGPVRAAEVYAPETLMIEGAWITAVAFSPDGQRIAFARDDGAVSIRKAAGGEELFSFGWPQKQAGAMAFSPDGGRLAIVSTGKEISLWDTATGQLVKEAAAGVPLADIAFSPDGGRLIAPGQDGKLHLFDAATLAGTGAIAATDALITSAAFSPDGKRIAGVSLDRTARVWDAATGEETARFSHEAYLKAARFSADGARLATAGRDGVTSVFDLARNALIVRFAAGGEDLNDIAFSADGSRLATASTDDTIGLWDAATGASIATLKGHAADVASVRFGGDNITVFSTGRDATGRVWRILAPPPSGDLTALAGLWRAALDPGPGETLPAEVTAMLCQSPVRVQANGLVLFYEFSPPEAPRIARHLRCGADGACQGFAGEPAPGLGPAGTATIKPAAGGFTLCTDGDCLDFVACEPVVWSDADRQSGYDRAWTGAMEKAWE